MPTLPTTLAFLLIVLVVIRVWIRGFRRLSLRHAQLAAAALLAILLLTAALAHQGLLHAEGPFPPPMLRLVLAGVLAVIGLVLSPVGLRLARTMPLAGLIGLQVFRLPLEFVLWQLYREGALPVQMTFEGRNFDVLSGLLALPLAIAIHRSQQKVPNALIWAWNLLGLALLFNIVQIAVRSMPGPLRTFQNEPTNTLVFTVPWVWLPMILVLSALLGHLLVARRLLAEPRRESVDSPG